MDYKFITSSHDAIPNIRSYHNGITEMLLSFYFMEDCFYIYPDTQINHTNKIRGFSLDTFNLNSLRLVWRPDMNLYNRRGIKEFSLFPYLHVGGKASKIMSDLKILNGKYSTFPWEHKYYAKIKYWKDAKKAEFVVSDHLNLEGTDIEGGVSKVMPMTPSLAINLGIKGWLMNPYFGGSPLPPQIMNFGVSVINTK